MPIHDTLSKIQCELTAPKGRKNEFGKYTYRSCEDILQALKPLLNQYCCAVVMSDQLVQIGDRYYIHATATLHQGSESVSNSAFARECLDRKGMDEAQITGSASSYARKYALAGLFAIDGEADPDSRDNRDQPANTERTESKRQPSQARKDLCAAMESAKFRGIDPNAIYDALNAATNGTDWKALTDEQMIAATTEIDALGV